MEECQIVTVVSAHAFPHCSSKITFEKETVIVQEGRKHCITASNRIELSKFFKKERKQKNDSVRDEVVVQMNKLKRYCFCRIQE